MNPETERMERFAKVRDLRKTQRVINQGRKGMSIGGDPMAKVPRTAACSHCGVHQAKMSNPLLKRDQWPCKACDKRFTPQGIHGRGLTAQYLRKDRRKAQRLAIQLNSLDPDREGLTDAEVAKVINPRWKEGDPWPMPMQRAWEA